MIVHLLCCRNEVLALLEANRSHPGAAGAEKA
jgi:hypothetical protein